MVNDDRTSHPNLQVRDKMWTSWLLHCGLTRQKAAEIVGVSRATVQRYVEAYRQGGLDGLRRSNVQKPVSELAPFRDIIRASFEDQLACTIAETCDPAIDLIGLSNKDRPESRSAFVGKVATLLQRNVRVSLVDVVTIREFNLYAELLEFIGGNDPALASKPPCLYALTIRGRERPRRRSLLDSWFYPMHIGQSLPTLPIWLDVDLNIALDLESSFEETCRFLRIS